VGLLPGVPDLVLPEPPWRAVLDPGVYVSAILNPTRTPARLVDRLLVDARWDQVVSPLLLDELSRVLHRAKLHHRLDAALIAAFVAQLVDHAFVAEDPAPAGRPLTADPKDDYLVALSAAVDATVLVSGDRHLTTLTAPPVPVLTPTALLTAVQP